MTEVIRVTVPAPITVKVSAVGARGPAGPSGTGGGIEEAPLGGVFARENEDWVEIVPTHEVVTEAPGTGQTFVRRGDIASWEPISVLPPRPTDARLYGMKQDTWTPIDTVEGPPGPAGADSTVPGPQGPPGKDSTVPGPAGPAGADSTVPGPPGPVGKDSVIPGPAGKDGTPGSVWTTGNGAPSTGSARVGDMYLDTATGNVYRWA